VTCSDAVRLIGSAIEGGVSRRPLRALTTHLEQCQSCCAEAMTQILVKRTLAATPDARPPDTLVEKIARRLDVETASAKPADRRGRPPQKKTAARLV
jgi:hypothetical protein